MYCWVRINKKTGEITDSFFDSDGKSLKKALEEEGEEHPVKKREPRSKNSDPEEGDDVTEDEDHIALEIPEEVMVDLFCDKKMNRFPDDKERVRKMLNDDDGRFVDASKVREELKCFLADNLGRELTEGDTSGLCKRSFCDKKGRYVSVIARHKKAMIDKESGRVIEQA